MCCFETHDYLADTTRFTFFLDDSSLKGRILMQQSLLIIYVNQGHFYLLPYNDLKDCYRFKYVV